jgi:hypothetical protein
MLQEMFKRFEAAPEANRDEIAVDMSNVGMVKVDRLISPQKGRFRQVPPREESTAGGEKAT